MAATFAFRVPGEGFNPSKVPGAYYDTLIEVTADASYPLTATNGYPFGLSDLQTLTGGSASLIESVEIVNPWMKTATGAQTAAMAAFDRVHNTIRAYGSNGAAPAQFQEFANATSLANLVCTIRVRWH